VSPDALPRRIIVRGAAHDLNGFGLAQSTVGLAGVTYVYVANARPDTGADSRDLE
jgi:hypothetical protein